MTRHLREQTRRAWIHQRVQLAVRSRRNLGWCGSVRIAEILRIGTSVSNVTPTIPSSCSQISASWDSGIEVDIKCLSRPSVSGLTGIVGTPENVCGPGVWRETLTHQSGGVTVLSKKAPGLPSLSPPEPYDGSSERVRVLGKQNAMNTLPAC